MANIRNSSKSGLFLIELIIAIVFFAMASAICVQLFVHAHMITQSNGEITTAIIEARNAAECFRAADGSAETLAGLLGVNPPETSGESASYVVYYDGDWQRVLQTGARYELRMDTTGGASGLAAADVTVRRIGADTVIYRLESKNYTAA